MAETQNTQAPSQYPDTPEGRAQLWTREFEAAREWLKPWREKGEDIVAIYLDERKDGQASETHLNFYWANVRMLLAMLYGKTPSVAVTRRFSDPNDQLARVSAEMLERVLNNDIERYDDGYRDALASTLFDYAVPGFGNSRVRYQASFEEKEQPERGKKGTPRYAAATKSKVKASEEAVTDYVYWNDQLWSPCRVHADKRWHAFMAPMTRDDLHKRFDAVLGEQEVENIPLNAHPLGATKESAKGDPWSRAEVWEVWDKQRKEVVWFIEGYPKVLDVKPDPLGLTGFWPFPRPLLANPSTTKHLPRPDYAMAQDLYHDINTTATRITELEDALRVAGVYDQSVKGIQRLMNPRARNELIPITGYAALAEKGGLDKAISWLPMEQVVETLDKLKEQLAEKQRLLYEITGWSDLMRGQVQDSQQLATTTRAVVRYGSVRVQAIQDDFARYASDLQRLRAEIIVKFFDDETIITRSNIMKTPDAPLAKQALQFLRQDFAKYAIEVKPEAIAQADFAAMKQERTEFMQAFIQAMEAGGRLTQSMGPQGTAMLLPVIGEVVRWTMSGFRGSSEMDGVMERFLTQAQQLAQQAAQSPAPADPKAQAAQMKAQSDIQREQMKVQAEGERQQVKTQAEAQRQALQMQYNVAEAQQEAAIKSQQLQQKMASQEASHSQQMRLQAERAAARPVNPNRRSKP